MHACRVELTQVVNNSIGSGRHSLSISTSLLETSFKMPNTGILTTHGIVSFMTGWCG